MKLLDMNDEKFFREIKACLGVVKYKLGAKPGLHDEPGIDFKLSDCSGFVRWLLFKGTDGKTTLPDGSWIQETWCDNEGFNKNPYASVADNKDDYLRVAFIKAYRGKVGHIWLIHNGKTIECYGGVGVGRRPWNTKTLLKEVSDCYTIAKIFDNHV